MLRVSKFRLLFILTFCAVLNTGTPQGTSCPVEGCDPDRTRFTVCGSDDKCVCADETDSIFIAPTQTCYKQADTSCDSSPGQKRCVPNSQCINRNCRCNTGLERNSEGLCFISYDNPCDTARDLCDSSAFLYCGLQMKCECKNPENSTYASDSSCRLLAGSPCENVVGSQQCIYNAGCTGGKCTCNAGFYETASRSCLKKLLSYGEDCEPGDSPDLCDTDRYLECDDVSRKCHCKGPEKTFYDPSTNQCFLLEKSDCQPDGQLCAPNSECLNEICKCNLGLVGNAEGRCFLEYGNACNFEVDLCDPASFLYCGLEQRCSCNNPQDSMYDIDDLSCKLLAGAKCSGGGQSCVSDSTCDLHIDKLLCKCSNDFVETESRTCEHEKLQYGETCSPGVLDFCDRSQFLECNSENQCDCKIPANGNVLFDDKTKMCYLLHGASCNPDDQPCAANSECLYENDGHKCLCEAKMEPNSLGLCFIPYDHECKSSNDLCDPFEHLECGDEDKCNCKNISNSVYEKSDGKCHLLVDAECTLDGQMCISNAKCDESNVCLCEDDFHANDSRLCVPDKLNFEDSCNPVDDKCNREKFLHCNTTTSVCDCLYENSWYSSATQMCYYLAEADCTVNVEQNCVPNAVCNNDGVCQCNDGLFPNENKLCHVNYLGRCDHTFYRDLCDPMQFLECGLTGLCDCKNLEETWYNSSSSTCEILATGHCSTTEQENGKIQSCVAKASCTENKVCECQGDFSVNSTKFCTLGHGKNCLGENYGQVVCNPENYLECGKNGRCGCKNDEYSYYDEKTDYCFLTEGSPCDINGQKCGPKSNCLRRHGEKDFKCTCADGLTPNENGLCFLPYNSSCSANQDLCDPDAFLYCGVEHKCDCKDTKLVFYNTDAKKCQLLAKSECHLDERRQCVENAACIMTPTGNAMCQCLGNFTIDDDRHCRLLHGVPCSRKENLCDSKKFLTCSEYGQCDCLNVQATHYDYQTQYCYLLAGIQCNTSGNFQKCVQNAHCDSLSHTCQCNTDIWQLEANSLGYCSLRYSKPCSTDNDLCDRSGFLQCSSNKQCACRQPDKTWYNPASDACELKAGVPCSLDGSTNQKCHSMSECKPIGGGGSNNYICTCLDNLSPNANGICYLKRGQSCELDSKDLCDPAAFLSCELPSKKCDCNIPDTVFNEETQTCQRLAGGPCLTDENEPNCIANSHCSLNTKTCLCDEDYEFSKSNKSCLKSHGVQCNSTDECNGENNLSCIGQQCVCKNGYFPYEEADGVLLTQCLPGYLQTCSEEFPCVYDSGLICTPDSLCQCSRPHEQIFEPEKRKCVGLQGAPCTFDDDHFGNQTTSNCVSNADCVNINGLAIGVCQCDIGYESDASQICVSGSTSIVSFKLAILMFQIALLTVTPTFIYP